MLTPIHWIKSSADIKLGISARPRGGEWLRDEIEAWSEAGVRHVVSTLTREETADLDLADEQRLCHAAEITFHVLPIADRGVPASREPVESLVATLAESLRQGNSVAIHCRQGIGRSSLVAALLMVELGDEPESAFEAIEEARGCHVPDTAEQRRWVQEYAGSTNAGAQSDTALVREKKEEYRSGPSS